MRVLVMADIHGNLEALRAVLDHARQMGGFGRVWCMGDVVGYGPDPGPCVDMVEELSSTCVAGNHDWAAVGKVDTRDFNPHAAAAIAWTDAQLTPGQREYLSSLPLTLQEEGATLVHGSLRDPIWEYLVDTGAARATFDLCQTPLCLVGHSHMPFVCTQGEGFRRVRGEGDGVALGPARLILNPGSVGQPRDGDPRASYMLLDIVAQAAYHYRVAYAIGETQGKMERAGLPRPLIDRLSQGW
ncbi:MAG: metallophosphoesterase family protein [Chloroflexi bacterium]|nr:metallophosphoesterase family protein [Chloroflexota bacterium]